LRQEGVREGVKHEAAGIRNNRIPTAFTSIGMTEISSS
jgi:hypothetical protein